MTTCRRSFWNMAASERPRKTGSEVTIAGIAQRAGGTSGRHDGRAVKRFGRIAQPSHRPREIDKADLFGPQVVFGHVGKAAKGTDAARIGDAPAGFLDHLAVQRGDGRFAGVDAAAGQLQVGMGLRL